MNRIARSLAVFAIATVAGLAATAGQAMPWGGNVYQIRHDGGGTVIDYAIKMRRLEQSGRQVQVSGTCASACTLFLALPREQLCVSRGAAFGFHLPHGAGARGNRVAASFMMNSYPAWVRSWIHANGGLTTQLKVMRYDHARRHLPDCAGERVAAR